MEGNRSLITALIVFMLIFAGGADCATAAEAKKLYQKDPQSCAKCHLIKPYVESWKNSEFLDHKHEKAGVSCLDCHQLTPQQERANVAKFNKKTFKSPLEEREFANDLCFRCHGSYLEIAERTKDFQQKGLPRNPHQSHYGEMDCNLCHKSHRTSVDYCSQCHQPGVHKPGWKAM